MANHRIDESNSEYNASFLSTHERRNTRSAIDLNNRASGQFTNQAVLEVDEDEESEQSRKYSSNDNRGKRRSPKFGNTHQEKGLLDDTPDASKNNRRMLTMGF